ncbi:ProQ/FinO family protein [Calidifontimicrobium sp. SYSU G02091]|uniref:ProQ/FINO family protein n=1 Tax=Calidifontimicrobium sp. SYSU G02091 TaxID=2926421 RepID=UPI001F52F285|nr:ProQ/FinO family protein [Calidifontimicrobium sp. SYSU G02091]MCI1191718.1 ProQ/FinO family protein [Calidifontimicrobium sp. SYSU G02091]
MSDPDDALPNESTPPAASPEPHEATTSVATAADGAAPPAASMTPAQCGQRLAELFPALFAGAPKPLKLRVHADIQARAPGVFSKAVLSAFMRRYTNSTAYLNAVARGTQRIGLDGEPAGEIAPEHRQAALDELARRRERHAAQRAAEREAARAAERAEHEARAQQAQARRARAQLLRDFERTTLTAANFAALKGLAPDALQAQLELARREAAERAALPHARGPGGPGHPAHGGRHPGRRDGRGRPRAAR